MYVEFVCYVSGWVVVKLFVVIVFFIQLSKGIFSKVVGYVEQGGNLYLEYGVGFIGGDCQCYFGKIVVVDLGGKVGIECLKGC